MLLIHKTMAHKSDWFVNQIALIMQYAIDFDYLKESAHKSHLFVNQTTLIML